MNYQEMLEDILNNLPKTNKPRKLLLHACCAPCSSYVIEYLSNYFDITIYYYNPNIEPVEEFDKRAREITKFISSFKTKNPVKCVIETYDNSEYENAIKGHENDDEGKDRCFICYRLRMEKAAKYAKKHHFSYFTTTLSISPYKNANKLNEIGEQLEKEIGINYLYADFKKKNGYKRSIELSNEYNLYRQDYCGCKYSKIARDKREEEKKKREEERLLKEQDEKRNNSKVNLLYDNFYNKDKTKKRKKDKDPDMFKFDDIKKNDLNKISFFRIMGFIFKIILSFGLVILGIYLIYKRIDLQEEKIPTEDERAKLNEIYVYGNHLNIKGEFECDYDDISDVNLVFVGSSNNIEYDLNYSKDNNIVKYNLSDKLNKGFNLDNVMIDNYIMFIKVLVNEETLYYAIDNQSNYKDTVYYSVSDENNNIKKMIFEDNNRYDSMKLNVSKSSDDVYDIALDPGHGGSDKGACYNSKCETDYTLDLANLLKKDLEDKGFKVMLTRNTNSFLGKYGDDGRVTRALASNAKLLLSIHLNASGPVNNGFELYTSNNVDYTFARNLTKNLDKISDFTYSYNKFSKVEPGIYTRTFDNYDLKNIADDAAKKKYQAFNVNGTTNYYFMIRETGGYMTGAYVDGRDGDDANPYVLSNRGIESYILELGYITSQTDLDYINKYMNDYIKSVSDSITDYLNK